MTRIRFEDLPSTNTPRNAENLNKLNNVVISPTEPTTGEEVWIQKGKNLFNYNSIKLLDSLTQNDGEFTFNSAFNYATLQYIYPFEIGIPYTFSFNVVQTSFSSIHHAFFFYKDGTYEHTSLTSDATGRHYLTLTPTKEVDYAMLRFFDSLIGQRTGKVNDIQIEQGSTATSYEPYVDKKIYTKNDNGVYEEFYQGSELKTDGEPVKCGYKVDGKDVYVKRVNLGSISEQKTYNIPHNLPSNITIVKVDGIMKEGTLYFPLPFYTSNSTGTVMFIYGGNITIEQQSARPSATGIVNIYFTYN